MYLELLEMFFGGTSIRNGRGGGKVLFDPPEQKSIYTLSKRLCRYAAKQKVKNIAFMDRSARCAWVGVDAYWKANLPLAAKPHLYFFNPEGFETPRCEKEFRALFKDLYEQRHDPLVLFDTCSHSGGTFRGVLRILSKIGFTDVRIVTANSPDKDSGIVPAKKIDQHLNLRGCIPFGAYDLVEKGRSVVCSVSRRCDRDSGILLRKQIRLIIAQEGEA